MQRNHLGATALVFASLWTVATASAQTSSGRDMIYSGTLENDGAAAVGGHDLRFALFASKAASADCLTATPLTGCGLWAEEHTAVQVYAGRFTVRLGSRVGLPDTLFMDNTDLWLAIAVREGSTGNFTLMSGKQQLGSAPFARYDMVMMRGVIVMWSGRVDQIPPGWALCNGQTVNGQVTPDLRGRFVVGAANDGSGQSGIDYGVRAQGGEEFHQLLQEEMPRHWHGTVASDTHKDYDGNQDGTTAQSNWQYNELRQGGYDTGPTGNDVPHENRPPFLALAYIMKVY